MEDILKSDIFFVVTTIVVVIVGVFIVIALVRLLTILKNIKSVSRLAKDGADFAREDLGLIREDLKEKVRGTKEDINVVFKEEGILGLIKLVPVILFGQAGKKKRTSRSKK